MKKIFKSALNTAGIDIRRYYSKRKARHESLYNRYKDFTMMDKVLFCANLELCERFINVEGEYAECGVWRGGMSAAIAEIIGNNRKLNLFDSFEGLPQAGEIDGKEAMEWQQNKSGATYYNNCTAEQKYVQHAMALASQSNYQIFPGWFSATLPDFKPTNIGILRLDGDWYESILTSLKYLYPMVVENGLIILDDYSQWTGCSRAVHKYLSDINSPSRIHESPDGVTYILKKNQ
jgi:O-methyltransferase